MEENKKPGESSVIGDIIKQTTNDVLKPKTLEVASTATSDIIYAIGDWIVDIAVKGLAKWFKLEPPITSRTRGGRTNYNKISQTPQVNTALRASDELVEVKFENEQRAIEVIDAMRGRIAQFGKVSVGFLYEKQKLPQIGSDFRYGWTDPDEFGYKKNARGCFFDANKPKPLG